MENSASALSSVEADESGVAKMKITYEDWIPHLPAAVFPWIANPRKAMQWQKNVKAGKIIIDRPEIIGTTFREVIEENDGALEMEGTITRYIENKMIGFHLSSRIHELDVAYAVEEADEGTRITIEADIRWKFPLSLISLFSRRKMESGLTDSLRAEVNELKVLLEKRP